MCQTSDQREVRLPNSGQTFLVVILLILVLSLGGFSYYLYVKQGEITEKFTKELENQDHSMRETKDTVTEINQKIKEHSESLSDQDSRISSLRDEATSIKTAVSEIQNNFRNDLAALKSEASKSQETLLNASAKVQVQLDNLVAELKRLKASTPPVVTPIVEVKLDPGQAAPAKPDDKATAAPAPAAPAKPDDKATAAPAPAASAKPDDKATAAPAPAASAKPDDKATAAPAPAASAKPDDKATAAPAPAAPAKPDDKPAAAPAPAAPAKPDDKATAAPAPAAPAKADAKPAAAKTAVKHSEETSEF